MYSSRRDRYLREKISARAIFPSAISFASSAREQAQAGRIAGGSTIPSPGQATATQMNLLLHLSSLVLISLIIKMNSPLYSGPHLMGTAALQTLLVICSMGLTKSLRKEIKAVGYLLLTLNLIMCAYFIEQYLHATSKRRRIQEIISTITSYEEERGVFPSALAELPNQQHIELALIDDYALNSGEFTVYFHLATPAISHWYTSKTGWGCSED